MRVRHVVVVVLGAFAGTGCIMGMAREVRFVTPLTRVERPDRPPQPMQGGRYADDWIAVTWTAEYRRLDADLRVTSNDPVVVRWDRAVFVSQEGDESVLVDHPALHATESRKLAVTLAPGTSRTESVYPATRVSSFQDIVGGENVFHHRAEAEAFARGALGKEIRVRLPVEQGGTTREYVFVFTPRSFEVRRILYA